MLSTQSRGPEQLLLGLLRGEVAPDARDPRWPGALALGRRHGVLPLLEESAHELPLPIARELRRERASQSLQQSARAGGEARALAALDGLRPVLLKGAAYGRTIYAQAELRPRGDLDVLVAPEAAAEAARRLVARGFLRHAAARGGVLDDRAHHEQTLVHPREPGVVVDLHRAFCQPQRTRVEVAAMVARAGPAPGGPPGTRVLDADDSVLAHAVNLATHELRVPLILIADLARLWSRCAPQTVLARARSYRVERALLAALWLLERCAEPAPPAGREPSWASEQDTTGLDEERSSFGGVRVELSGLRRARRELASRQRLAESAIDWLVRRYDLARRPLGRAEQLARKAVLIDRATDAMRFALAHAGAVVRASLRGGPSPNLLSWEVD